MEPVMKCLQNLHTHTTYCDGIDTPEEMIQYAIDKGFDSLGFSGHSYMSYSSYSSITLENTENYKREVRNLQEKYRNKLEVFLGLEVDMYSGVDLSGYDYLIGSLHYLKMGDEYLGFDRSAKDVKQLIDARFDGDGMRFAKAYYEQVAKLPQYGNFDIIGHFDIITKHCENVQFFDRDSKEYQWAAIEAAEQLAGKIPYFEVNTGAMARGYRTSPYPDLFLLKELKRLGFGAIISTDCHDSRYLDYGYQEALELLRGCGFKEQFVLMKDGFVPVKL